MRLPERRHTAAGEPRRAGFEFEFAGLEPRQACEAVVAVMGGEVREDNPFRYTVRATSHGDARVEMDAAVLTERRYLQALERLGVRLEPGLSDGLETALLKLSKTLVPCEVVLPPIALGELDVLEALREELRRRRAKGTRASPAYAFGMHINVEPPDLGAETLTAYLRAFALLHDHVRALSEVDPTRSVSPYIDKYPGEYMRLVANPSYRPASVRDLAADYLAHNPTRNRPLDMLPVLAHLEPGFVAQGVAKGERGLVKARPALHYRLPNCRIDEAAWSVEAEWDNWLLVERLAADPALMAAMGRDYLDRPGFPGGILGEAWAERAARWMDG